MSDPDIASMIRDLQHAAIEAAQLRAVASDYRHQRDELGVALALVLAALNHFSGSEALVDAHQALRTHNRIRGHEGSRARLGTLMDGAKVAP